MVFQYFGALNLSDHTVSVCAQSLYWRGACAWRAECVCADVV